MRFWGTANVQKVLRFAGQNASRKMDGEACPADGCGTRSVRVRSCSDWPSSGIVLLTFLLTLLPKEPRGVEKSCENLRKTGISSDEMKRDEKWKVKRRHEMGWHEMRTHKMSLHGLQSTDMLRRAVNIEKLSGAEMRWEELRAGQATWTDNRHENSWDEMGRHKLWWCWDAGSSVHAQEACSSPIINPVFAPFQRL